MSGPSHLWQTRPRNKQEKLRPQCLQRGKQNPNVPTEIRFLKKLQKMKEISIVTLLSLQAFLYSLERRIPLVAFSQDRCFSPFDDPLIEALHSVYHEPRVQP